MAGRASGPGALLTHLAVAADDVLVGSQLAQADRATSVQLLGRVADLGAHPELEAVGEAGRGVGVDNGGVDARREPRNGLFGTADDRLRVAGGGAGWRVSAPPPAPHGRTTAR